MLTHKEIIGCVIIFILGLGIGYFFGNNSLSKSINTNSGMHMMSDGTMMHNTDHTMSMSAMMASMNQGLKGKTGREFDMAFLKEMIVHHEGAVEMAQLALTNAERQEIKNLAQVIISAQNNEIKEMKTWLKNWYVTAN